MSEIALAYSSIDKARAEAVARVLEALGYKLAPQPLSAASVSAAKALIVFWSSGSVNSIPINQLASEASMDRKLISVRAGHADPPAAFALVALHDLSRWTGSLEAPELRTFLQHVVRMAPPANPQGAAAPRPQPPPQPAPPPRPTVNIGGASAQPFSFAGGPIGAIHPPPRPMQPPQPAIAAHGGSSAAAAAAAPRPAPPAESVAPGLAGPRASAQQWVQNAQPQAPLKPDDNVVAMPQRRIAERATPRPTVEPRRARGGAVARIAFGAIAVSVIAGAAVAAFNYQSGSSQTADTGTTTTSNTASAPVSVAVAPNALPSAPAVAAPVEAPQTTIAVAANTLPPLPGPAVAPVPDAQKAVAPAATVQSPTGWTSSLPRQTAQPLPSAPKATLVSGGAQEPIPGARPRRAIALTPVDRPAVAPAPTDLVAVDNANLGEAPRARTPDEDRAWLRKQGEYGPPQ